jgi:RHS repeat-associated protein
MFITLANRPRGFKTSLNSFATLTLILLFASAARAQTTTTSNTDGRTPSGMQGGSPSGSYALGGFDNVNLYNGNLDFRLPLMKVGGRGSAQMAITLALNLKSWHVKHVHKVWPDGSETDSYSPTQNGWVPYGGYGAGAMTGRHFGLQVSSNFSCRWYSKTLARITFSTADGTEYELRDQQTGGQPLSSTCTQGASRGTIFITADGSAATFISDTTIYDNPSISTVGPRSFSPSGYLLLRDGTRYRIDTGKVTWIRDRNGNKLSFTYDANGRVVTIVDSLSRHVTVNYDVSDVSPYGLCDQIIFSGVGGAQRVIRISKTSLGNALRPGAGYSIKTLGGASGLFPELNSASTSTTFNPTVASAVWLPNGKSYKLFYNSYGELARFELLTGGATEYDMTAGSGVVFGCQFCDEPQIYRRLVERRVYPAGGTGAAFEHKETYANAETASSTSSTITVEDVAPDGTVMGRSRHYFNGSALASLWVGEVSSPYGVWYEGTESQTEALATAGSAGSATVLSRAVYTRMQRAAVSWWASYAATYGLDPAKSPPNDPRLVTTVTTVEPSGANLVTKRTSIDPQTGAVGFDQSNNPTDVWEYDYSAGAAPAYATRHTHTDYLTTNNGIDYTSYNGPHLRGLVRAQQVYSVNTSNGTQTLVSQSETRYDETGFPLLTYASVTGWDDPVTTARGNPTTGRRWLNTNNSWLETHTQYDQVGNVRKSWDARDTALTNPSLMAYGDSFCNDGTRCGGSYVANTYAFPTAVTTSVPQPDSSIPYGAHQGFTTTTVFDYYTGLTYSTTDANNQTTTLSYVDAQNVLDPLERIRGVTRPDGSRISFNYGDTVGNLYVQVLTDLDASRRTETRQYFDGMGRSVRSFTWENQDTSKPWLTVDTQYDALGRAWRASSQYRSAGPGSAVNPSGRWTETTFDSLNRVTQVKTTADNAAVTTSYSGNTTTVTDQHASGSPGRSRKTVTDSLGRLTSVYEDPSGTLNYLTSYQYDALDNLRLVTQGAQTRTFVYDSLGRLTSSNNPETGTVAYTYDNNGNVLTKTDARGVTATYIYDALNRNTTADYSDTAGVNPDVRCYFDGAVNGKGRFYYNFRGGDNLTGTNVEHTAIDSYDLVGRPLVKRQLFKTGGVWGQTYQTQRTYDRAGNVLTETYPSQRAVTYNYDAAGRPGDNGAQAAFTGNVGDGVTRTYASEVRYHELGGMEQRRFGTDTAVYNKGLYNSRGQLAEIRVSTYSLLSAGHETDWNRGAVINHYSTSPGAWGATGGGPDNNGNLQKQETYIPDNDQISSYTNVVQEYGYDALNRLTVVYDKPFNGAADFYQSYTYDRWGNRTINAAGTANAPAPQYAASSSTNRLSAPAGYTMSYDAAGNLTYDNYRGGQGGGGARAYDAENHMTSAQFVSGVLQTAIYTYDAFGNRTRRNTGAGGEVWYVYGMDGELLAEYAANASPSSPQKEYGYQGGEMLVTAEPAATVKWFVTDQLGTSRMVVDRTGSLSGVRRHDYLPFGEEVGADANWRTAARGYVGDTVRQKFTGYERDGETGEDFAQARYYESWQGRFSSTDPLPSSARVLNPQTWNRYAYTLNNPLRFVDPSGMVEGDAQQQQQQQQPAPQTAPPKPAPTPATESATLANVPANAKPGLPTTVVVTQQNTPALGIANVKGVESLVVGVALVYTFYDQEGNPVTDAKVTETVTDSSGQATIQATDPVPLTDKGRGADLVSNDSGPVPKTQAERDKALETFNKDFTTDQTLKLTVTTGDGRVVQVTQKRTLTNKDPKAPRIDHGMIRGYTFTMEKPKIELVK